MIEKGNQGIKAKGKNQRGFRYKKGDLRKKLRNVLRNQLNISGIKNLDFDTYVEIACWVFTKIDFTILEALNNATLDLYLKDDAIVRLSKTRRDKIKYVLQLIADRMDRKTSNTCEGIEVVCNYCGAIAKLADRKMIGGNSHERIYVCSNYPVCDAYVGVHKGDNWPCGTLANKELRKLRNQAHRGFDRLWRSKELTRREAYGYLQEKMKLKKFQTHIGCFNIEQCHHTISICNEYKKEHLKEEYLPEIEKSLNRRTG